MAMELIHIRTAQQYSMLVLTLIPGKLATRERPYDSLATLWTIFAHLKHNTSPAIDGETFPAAFQDLTSHAHLIATSSSSTTVSLHRNTCCNGRPDATQGVPNVSHTLLLQKSFSVDYGLLPTDGHDYDIVCTVANNIINTD